MPKSYPAELVDGQLSWLGEAPPEAAAGRVEGEVTIKPQPETAAERKARGERLIAAVERLRAMGGIPGIPDPAAWQREIRQDKPLVGRNNGYLRQQHHHLRG